MELPANDDVIKAYHELKRLREDVERIERSSTLPADAPKGDDDEEFYDPRSSESSRSQ
jgi:hypothetical protein